MFICSPCCSSHLHPSKNTHKNDSQLSKIKSARRLLFILAHEGRFFNSETRRSVLPRLRLCCEQTSYLLPFGTKLHQRRFFELWGFGWMKKVKKRGRKEASRGASLIIITADWQSRTVGADSARQPNQKAHLLLVSLNDEPLIWINGPPLLGSRS